MTNDVLAVYANSFLATLNTRRALGAESQRTRDTEGLNVSNIQWATPGPVGSTNVTGSTFQSTNIASSGRPSTPVSGLIMWASYDLAHRRIAG
jgi:hypothetical protein